MKTAGIVVTLLAIASTHAAPMPFIETFDELAEGPLDTQNEWTVLQGTATVQTNVVHGGKAAELVNASVSHALSSDRRSFWATVWARYDQAPEDNPPMTRTNASVAFFISNTGKLVVYSNAVPVELDVTVAPNVWTRFDVYCDYDDMFWNLSMNKTHVVSGLPLSSEYKQPVSVDIQHASSYPVYVDDLAVVDEEPVQDPVDDDGDSLPDWWEQKYFGDIAAAELTPSILRAYIAGLAPSKPFEISGTHPIRWTGQPGRRYAVYATPDLSSPFTFLTYVLWDQAEFIDLVNTNEPTMFYRVGVELDQPVELTGSYPLRWTGLPGRRYAVYATPDLKSPFTFQTYVPWDQAEYTDLINTNEPSMFYRISVELDQ